MLSNNLIEPSLLEMQGAFHLNGKNGENFLLNGTRHFFLNQNGTGRGCSFHTELLFLSWGDWVLTNYNNKLRLQFIKEHGTSGTQQMVQDFLIICAINKRKEE